MSLHEPTAVLLQRFKSGDETAREQLFQRCLPLLQQWAHGRLPVGCRDLNETADLVQTTMLRALRNLDHFEDRGAGSLLAYLRTILSNAVREEIRRMGRKPLHTDVPDLPGRDDTERHHIDLQAMARYEQALKTLKPAQRDAVVLRLEFGLPFAEIAQELGRPSADAARMLVTRGVAALSQAMQ